MFSVVLQNLGTPELEKASNRTLDRKGVGAGAQRALLVDCTLLVLERSSVWTQNDTESLGQSHGTLELEGTWDVSAGR